MVMRRTYIGRFIAIISFFLLSVACSKEVEVMSVQLSESSVTLLVGETATLVATVEPSIADYDGISWTSSDPSVATVTDGVVQVHKAGTATITASAGGVISRACTVTVDLPVVEVNDPVEPVEPEAGTPETVESGETTESTDPVESGESDTLSEESEEVDAPEVEAEEAIEEAEPELVEIEAEEPEDPVVLGRCFVYDVDFGEEGSYINIDSLITVTDWRDRDLNDYPNYWGYYGPFVITFDLKNAECDLNGKRQLLPHSATLFQTEPGVASFKDPESGSEIPLPENRHGFLMCKFITTELTGTFNIYVKAKVKYGFGTIETDWITIPVVMELPKQS
jgi:hypothetical protein